MGDGTSMIASLEHADRIALRADIARIDAGQYLPV
jgi:hypothetical protein